MTTVTVEIVVWDDDKAEAVVEKIRKDSRVVSVERIDQ